MNTQKGKYRHLLLYGGSVVVAVICLFPIFFALFASFKPNREMYLYPPSILPKTWTLEAYLSILSQKKYLFYFFNAWVISTCTTLVCVILGALAGYGFSRFRLPAKRLLMLGILALTNVSGRCVDDSVLQVSANLTSL